MVLWKDNRLDVHTDTFLLNPRTQKSMFEIISSAVNKLIKVTFNSSSHYHANEDAETARGSTFLPEGSGMAKSRSSKFVRQLIILLQCDTLVTVTH